MSKTTRRWLEPIFRLTATGVLGLSAATPCVADPVQTAAAAASSSPPAASEQSQPDEPGFLQRAARIRADVVRRVGGEWVIVGLGLGPRDGRPPSGNDDSINGQPALRAMLQEYEHAFEEQNAQRLAAVWLMNPSERAEIDRMFAEMSSVSVSVSNPVLLLESHDRGHLEFDQQFRVARLTPGPLPLKGPFQRALAAHDAYGDWNIDKVIEQR